MNEKFNDKTAVVTGAGSGIGRASAIAFAKEGARVMVSDIDTKGGEETVNLIQAFGGVAQFFQCDVSKSNQVEGLMKEVIKSFGRLDFAVNNAGISMRPGLTADIDEEEWDRVISINLKSVWLCMKYEIPMMLNNGGGAIINMSSLAGIRGRAHTIAYSASKHGIIGMTKTAALEYAQKGIRINAICPGLTESGMTAGLSERSELAEKLIQKIPMGHMGLSENIADAVTWLCTDSTSFMTGQVIVVDGGETIA
jgi:NAD(P)-dependent dehydrogenase (short-subunit alcohol dehydrogenase family)